MKAAIVGLRMGANHARAVASLDGVDLVGLCDIDSEVAKTVAGECVEIAKEAGKTDVAEAAQFTDFNAMLRKLEPEIVGIATPNRFHAEMTIAAVEAGAKAVYCEKPIAVDLGEARRMVEVCRKAGVPLVVNHQRRTGEDFVWLREQITSGAIGDVYLVRGTCAGDMLSDGTHLIDSVLYLTGDQDWKWVFAAHHRDVPEEEAGGGNQQSGGGFHVKGGWRFGHPVEDGMMAVCELESGLRVELLTGDLRQPDRPYHDIEIIGSKGSFWRRGDRGDEIVLRRTGGGWEAVPEARKRESRNLIADAYAKMVDLVRDGKSDREHPMGAPYTMRGFELLMGAYESARTRTVISRPVEQEKYPLAVELGLE
ncbi:MAG: Gfo/Idh/MocA family oxidoreductase [Spirochaetota bacterium]